VRRVFGKMCKIDQELEVAAKSRGSWEVGSMGRGLGKKPSASVDRMDLPAARNSKFRILEH
jgi:hypothetical protein